MLHTRWTLLEMRKDALQRSLPAPDEACAKHHCFYQGVEAPDLSRAANRYAYTLWKHCLLLFTYLRETASIYTFDLPCYLRPPRSTVSTQLNPQLPPV